MFTTKAPARSHVTLCQSSYISNGSPADVATMAKYSPQRFASHSPTASITSTSA